MKPEPRPKNKVIRVRKKPVIEIKRDKNALEKAQDSGIFIGIIIGIGFGYGLHSVVTWLH